MSAFPRPDYRTLAPYAPDRRPVAVDLSDNTNLWGPHPAALAALRGAGDDALARYPSVYADDLRRAVAARWSVAPDAVATGCGSDDLLDSTFRAVHRPDGVVAFPGPTFSMIPTFARMNGLGVREVPWNAARDDPGLLLVGDPAAIYVCDPNNPTGSHMPEGWVDALLAAGGARGPVVVLDEAYADFAGRSELTRAPDTDRLLVLRTLSKAYGLAGLRVGFAVGGPEVAAEVEKARGPYKVGRIDEAAAVPALEDEEGWVPGIVEATRRNRARLAEELRDRRLAPRPSRANFLLVPVEDARETAARLRVRGVAVRPFPGLPGIGDAVRVTVGPWALLERFLEALDGDCPSGPRGPEGGDGS